MLSVSNSLGANPLVTSNCATFTSQCRMTKHISKYNSASTPLLLTHRITPPLDSTTVPFRLSLSGPVSVVFEVVALYRAEL